MIILFLDLDYAWALRGISLIKNKRESSKIYLAALIPNLPFTTKPNAN